MDNETQIILISLIDDLNKIKSDICLYALCIYYLSMYVPMSENTIYEKGTSSTWLKVHNILPAK